MKITKNRSRFVVGLVALSAVAVLLGVYQNCGQGMRVATGVIAPASVIVGAATGDVRQYGAADPVWNPSDGVYGECITWYNTQVIPEAERAPKSYTEENINFEANDYAAIFFDAQSNVCAPYAVQILKEKLRVSLGTLSVTDPRSARPVDPFRSWLWGAPVTHLFASALILGAKGLITDEIRTGLDDAASRFGSISVPQDIDCGTGHNSCLDDYALTGAGFGWIAAYYKKTGRDALAAQFATQARNALRAGLSPMQWRGDHQNGEGVPGGSICYFNPNEPTYRNKWGGVHPNCYGDPSAPGTQIIGADHLIENPAYGLGMMSSYAAACVGLYHAGAGCTFDESEKSVMLGLAHHAQKKVDPSSNGRLFKQRGCMDLRDPLNTTKYVSCGDSSIQGEYNPGLFPVAHFYSRKQIGQFLPGLYAFSNYEQHATEYLPPKHRREFWGMNRHAIYGFMGGDFWNSSVPQPNWGMSPSPKVSITEIKVSELGCQRLEIQAHVENPVPLVKVGILLYPDYGTSISCTPAEGVLPDSAGNVRCVTATLPNHVNFTVAAYHGAARAIASKPSWTCGAAGGVNCPFVSNASIDYLDVIEVSGDSCAIGVSGWAWNQTAKQATQVRIKSVNPGFPFSVIVPIGVGRPDVGQAFPGCTSDFAGYQTSISSLLGAIPVNQVEITLDILDAQGQTLQAGVRSQTLMIPPSCKMTTGGSDFRLGMIEKGDLARNLRNEPMIEWQEGLVLRGYADGALLNGGVLPERPTPPRTRVRLHWENLRTHQQLLTETIIQSTENRIFYSAVRPNSGEPSLWVDRWKVSAKIDRYQVSGNSYGPFYDSCTFSNSGGVLKTSCMDGEIPYALSQSCPPTSNLGVGAGKVGSLKCGDVCSDGLTPFNVDPRDRTKTLPLGEFACYEDTTNICAALAPYSGYVNFRKAWTNPATQVCHDYGCNDCPPGGSLVPEQPTGLVYESVPSKKLKWTWSGTGPNPSSYEWALFGPTTLSGTTSQMNASLPNTLPAGSYSWQVRALRGSYQSGNTSSTFTVSAESPTTFCDLEHRYCTDQGGEVSCAMVVGQCGVQALKGYKQIGNTQSGEYCANGYFPYNFHPDTLTVLPANQFSCWSDASSFCRRAEDNDYTRIRKCVNGRDFGCGDCLPTRLVTKNPGDIGDYSLGDRCPSHLMPFNVNRVGVVLLSAPRFNCYEPAGNESNHCGFDSSGYTFKRKCHGGVDFGCGCP